MDDSKLEIDVKHASGSDLAIIDLSGQCNAYTAFQLQNPMSDLRERGVTNLVIDLSKVDDLDSTGLGVLVSELKRAVENDHNLILVCPNPKIRRVFEITGLEKVFDLVDTAEEADALIVKSAS